MRFKGLDLNLLVAFDSLLDTRNVSKSAERLNLSQSAVSAALARLRDYFNDPILVQHGRRMHPTAFAEGLSKQVHDALRQLDVVVGASTSFDPYSSQRVFRILTSDYVTVAVIVPLIERLAEVAPKVGLDLILPSSESVARLEEGLLDLIITPDGYVAPDHPAELLFEEEHVVVGWTGNPLLREHLTLERFLSARHISVSVGADRTPSFIDRHLESLGTERQIDIRAPSFATVPPLLVGTSRLSVMHERLARAMRRNYAITIQPLPVATPRLREMMQHHRARSEDEGLQWLRQQISEQVSIPMMD